MDQAEIRRTKSSFSRDCITNFDSKNIFCAQKIEVDCDKVFPSAIKIGTSILNDKSDIADALLESFFPAPAALKSQQIDITRYVDIHLSEVEIDGLKPFTQSEVTQADKSAPGVDGIGAEYIKSSLNVFGCQYCF